MQRRFGGVKLPLRQLGQIREKTVKNAIFSMVMLAALGFGNAAVAADYTCQDLIWGTWTVDHPEVPSACDSVVVRDGITYAKFNTTFDREFNDGSVKLRLEKPDGSFAVDTFSPPDGFKISLPASALPGVVGGETPFAKTPPGQTPFGKLPTGAALRLYVPEGEVFTLPVEEVVVVEEVVEVEPYVAPEPAPAMLPSTASQLPLVGLLGGIFVLLGGALAGLRRRF